MSDTSHCSYHDDTTVSIWAQLPAAIRQQIIGLLAQLAYNQVLAQWDLMKEKTNHVVSTQYPQNTNNSS